MRWKLAAPLLALLTASGIGGAQPSEDVNTRLRGLEDLLRDRDDVAGIVLCEATGATKAIVHVRQAHYIETLAFRYVKENGTPEEYETARQIAKKVYAQVNDVQRSAYGILGALADAGYPLVYADGISVEREADFTKAGIEEVTLQRLANLIPIGYFREDPTGQRYVIRRSMAFNMTWQSGAGRWELITPDDDTVPSSLERFRYIPGADLLLAHEGRIVLRGFEREAVYGIALETDAQEILMDGREDTFLDIAAQGTDDVLPAFLGGDHSFAGPESCPDAPAGWWRDRVSFRDNLSSWNRRTTPRFSLLEVTPRGIDEVQAIRAHEFDEVLSPLIRRVHARVKERPKPKGILIVGTPDGVTVEGLPGSNPRHL